MPASALGGFQESGRCGGWWEKPGGARRWRVDGEDRWRGVVRDDRRPLLVRDDSRHAERRAHAVARAVAPRHLLVAASALVSCLVCRLRMLRAGIKPSPHRAVPGVRHLRRGRAGCGAQDGEVRARHARQPVQGCEHHECGHEGPHHAPSSVVERHGENFVKRERASKSGEADNRCRENPAASGQRSIGCRHSPGPDRRRFPGQRSIPCGGVMERGVNESGVRRPATSCRSAAANRRGADGW